jgi:autotransporter translocation and assembly factor TamB
VSSLGSYPLVVGTVEVREGAIIGDLAKIPPPPPGATTGRSPWHAEIDVHAPGNLRLQTTIASVDLGEGDLHVSFVDPAFNVSGGITVLGGRYRVFNNVFNVTGGTVEFRDLGRLPEPILDINAETQVIEPGEPPTKVTITINVTGPLTKLDLAFSSAPSRTEDEIISLLSLGRFQNQQTGTIGAGTVASPGGQYIFTELVSQIESQITQLVSPLQNVTIQPGVAPNEPWKLNVRQNVLPQISLGYSRDLVLAQSATQDLSLRYNLSGVFYLNADVQRGLTAGTLSDRYSLDLKLRFEYK